MRWGITMILVFVLSALQAQQLLFENYSSEQGLSQNSCYTIAQDADGFMWFGTQDGLNRYDGKQFKNYIPGNDAGKNLPSNYISSLYFDRSKKLLWIGTIGGACIYDTQRDSLIKITDRYPFAKSLENVPVKKIVSFKENEYWIITYNKGLLLLNTTASSLTSYFGDSTNRAKVNSIVLHDGKLIVAALRTLFFLLPQTNSSNYQVQPLQLNYAFPEIKELFSYHDDLWIGSLSGGCFFIRNPINENSVVQSFEKANGGIGCFVTDANDNLWIGTRGSGIVQYNPFTQTVQAAAHDRYDKRSPGKNFVLSLFRDRQGLIWCGFSGSGVAKYDPLKYQFHTISNEPVNPASLPDNMVFDIYKCKDGTYYVGTQNKGLAEWNQSNNQFYTYTESSRFGASSNIIYDITEDKNNNLWVATWGGLMKLDRKTKLLSFKEEKNLLTAKTLYSIHLLNSADSLFITGENGPVFYSLKDNQWKPCPGNLMQSNAYIGRYIYEDEKNILWLCTVGGGLIRYDYRQQNFEIIEEVRKYSIYVRHLLSNGNQFWLATDNGIVVYDKVQKKVVKHILLNASNGSNVCYAIQKDKKGYLWTSTNTGLYRVNPDNYTLQNYNLGNGLSFLEYNTACTLKEPDGTLIFGGVDGITQFNPTLLKENIFSPDPLITSLNVNDETLKTDSSISRLSHLSLAHNQNFLTIAFAATNFSNQDNNQFAYRLKGLSDNWTYCGNRNFANYTSLPPGDYTFQLRSANSDGKWCAGITSMAITIHPPWWVTWWFRAGLLLVIAGITTWLVRRRIAAIHHEAGLKHKIAETEMMALRAQMNPHFIFNCINSIDALIQSNDKYHATVYLNKFAKLIRNILDSSKQNAIPLAKDVDTIKLYIELEQLRNENKFIAEINADEELLQMDYKVPPLIIQPFIENAILHGLRNRPDNEGKLSVSISRQNGHLQYIVEDNGVGRFAQSNSLKKEKQSYGLQITNDRVKLFNDEANASVEITDLSNNGQATGTRVKVFLKIK
jgi:ligand-binding sensor domain-containing protein/two-component sensor histidine kinase